MAGIDDADQDVRVPVPRIPSEIETDRLVLRRSRADDAAVYREMWTERDPRVPPQRRIGSDGRPTVEEMAARIRLDWDGKRTDFLTIVRKYEGDVIGNCGLLYGRRGSPEEADLAYELLRRAQGAGYATEAARAVTEWAGGVGYRRLWAGRRTRMEPRVTQRPAQAVLP